MKLLLSSISEIYRFVVTLLDRETILRKIKGRAEFDVACITNFETAYQKAFIGIGKKSIANGLRYSINGTLVRYILINSDASSTLKPQKRATAKQQLYEAIEYASQKGAKVILFAASTKRLLSEDEVEKVQREYDDIVFTIGDNGTSLALFRDVDDTIVKYALKKNTHILIIGANGFLGSAIKEKLLKDGYLNIVTSSYKGSNPFECKKDIRLIIACSHHKKLQLTKDILTQISDKEGVVVVDVCRPKNLSEKVYKASVNSGLNLVKIESGVFYNHHINYHFKPFAKIVLTNLGLTPNTLYACFSEATALAQSGDIDTNISFMKTNSYALDYVSKSFTKYGYRVNRIK